MFLRPFGLYCSACFGSLFPSSVHVVATFSLTVLFPLLCSVLPFFCLIHWRCIPKAANTHSEYVIIIAFPLQWLLHERPWMLRYMYISCLAIYNIQENTFLLHRNHFNTITKFNLLVFTLVIIAVYSDKYQTSTHFWSETQILWCINPWYCTYSNHCALNGLYPHVDTAVWITKFGAIKRSFRPHKDVSCLLYRLIT